MRPVFTHGAELGLLSTRIRVGGGGTLHGSLRPIRVTVGRCPGGRGRLNEALVSTGTNDEIPRRINAGLAQCRQDVVGAAG